MRVTVYTMQHCGYCTKQKTFLKENGIDFIEKDIHSSKENYDEFVKLGGLGTPLTIISESENIISKIAGFKKEKLLEELA